MGPESPRPGTGRTRGKRQDRSTHLRRRLGAERSLVQIQSPRLTETAELTAEKAAPSRFVAQGIADQKEGRWPEPDEERSALGVPALVLPDGLGADPEGDTEDDNAQ